MGAIWFIIGMFAGGIIGVTTMCCVQINRIKDNETKEHSEKRIR